MIRESFSRDGVRSDAVAQRAGALGKPLPELVRHPRSQDVLAREPKIASKTCRANIYSKNLLGSKLFSVFCVDFTACIHRVSSITRVAHFSPAALYCRTSGGGCVNVVSLDQPNRAESPTTTILVVDDNRMVTKALSSLIREAGYAPFPCHSGADAMTFADGTTTPCAAVVDIHLPDINGLILSQKLRDRFGPQTPIVVVSGDTSMETIKSLPHVGATYFFPKPVNATLLMGRLKELIENGASRESA
jgi:CheY-like chemotaxis protein